MLGWSDARLKFIPTNPSGGSIKNPDASSNTMYIGVGRGKFDEHKGNLADSATTLVYTFICASQRKKNTSIIAAALDYIVQFVNDDDHGRHINSSFAEFSISAALAYLPKKDGTSSAQITKIGMQYLDGIFLCLQEKFQLEEDWRRIHSFISPWGEAIGLETTVSAKAVLRRALQDKVELVVVLNPKNKFRSIRALAGTKVDLTKSFEQAHRLEPHAEWYLHQSKRMLICGSDVAENKILSKLPLKKIIDLIRV